MTSPTAKGQGTASQQCPAVCRSGCSQFTGTWRDEMQQGIQRQRTAGKRKTIGSRLGVDWACVCFHPPVHPSRETELQLNSGERWNAHLHFNFINSLLLHRLRMLAVRDLGFCFPEAYDEFLASGFTCWRSENCCKVLDSTLWLPALGLWGLPPIPAHTALVTSQSLRQDPEAQAFPDPTRLNCPR